MRRRIAFAVLAIVMIAVEACGLGIVGEALPGTEAGSPEGSTASDGPLGSSDGPSGHPDAGDALVETGVDANTPFCATTSHRFCRDFDDGADAGGAPEISTNGTLVLDVDSFSHPYALSAKIGPTQPDNHARLNFDPLAVLSGTVRFEVELRVDASGGPGDPTHLFTLQDVASATYGARLSVDGAGMLSATFTGPGAPAPTILQPIPTGWFHVVVTLAPNQVEFTIGATTTPIAWVSTVPPAIVLKLGLVGASSIATVLHIDNAALD